MNIGETLDLLLSLRRTAHNGHAGEEARRVYRDALTLLTVPQTHAFDILAGEQDVELAHERAGTLAPVSRSTAKRLKVQRGA